MMTKDIDCHAFYRSEPNTHCHAISDSSVSQYILQHQDQIKASHHDTSAVTTTMEYHCTLVNMYLDPFFRQMPQTLVVIPDTTIASETYKQGKNNVIGPQIQSKQVCQVLAFLVCVAVVLAISACVYR